MPYLERDQSIVFIPDTVSWGLIKKSRYPGNLLLLWLASSWVKSLRGAAPVYDGTPTVDADGVLPGAGPSFPSVVRGLGKLIAIKVKLTKSSTGVTGDEQVMGPLYIRNGYLVVKVDGQEAVHAHSWALNETVYVRIEATPSGLTVEGF